MGLTTYTTTYLSLFFGPLCRFAPVSILTRGDRTVTLTAIEYAPFSVAREIAWTGARSAPRSGSTFTVVHSPYKWVIHGEGPLRMRDPYE